MLLLISQESYLLSNCQTNVTILPQSGPYRVHSSVFECLFKISADAYGNNRSHELSRFQMISREFLIELRCADVQNSIYIFYLYSTQQSSRRSFPQNLDTYPHQSPSPISCNRSSPVSHCPFKRTASLLQYSYQKKSISSQGPENSHRRNFSHFIENFY